MKRLHIIIGMLLLVALAACHRPPMVVEPVEKPSPALSAIDSLLWQQPDSALMALMAYEGDSSDYNRHYAQLLTSELLYKNDYAQTNRPELQQAVAYFDSLVGRTPPLQRRLGGFKTRPNPIGQMAFLAARAHYINGVGYYENDSAVPACREYLKALEIMEGRFEEKELVGKRARFMALAYTHLTGLFSDQYLHEQAIYFGKEALVYYQKYDATPWHLSWMLCEIGSQYEMKGVLDSAICYYQKGEKILPDTNNLSFRDLASRLAFLSYVQGEGSACSLRRLKSFLGQAESEKEYFARCLTIGRILFRENDFDSAWIYLNKIYHSASGVESKRQAAEWLVEICNAQGRTEDIHEYAHFLMPFANLNENQSHVKSQLANTLHDYERERLEIAHKKQLRKLSKYAGVALALLVTLAAVFVAFHFAHKKRHKHLQSQKEAVEKQLETERYAHEIQKKALAGRLKRSNETLKEHRKSERKTSSAGEMQVSDEFPCSFAEEPVCRHILSVCNDAQNPIKSTVPVSAYADIALTDAQKAQLKEAAMRHYGPLFGKLKQQYPTLKEKDWLYCCLCLLDLNNVQIAVLLQKSNSTIWEREKRLQKIFDSNDKVATILRDFITI